jgi:xanthine/uracil permease
VTNWGILLLCAYVALGLSPATRSKAGRLAVLFTTVVIGAVMASFGAVR